MIVRYNHEYPRRVRLAAIGCGGHALRNVFPTHAYAPVDLVAVCDLDRERASHCARAFGAAAVYTDYREMLREARPEAVQVVTDYGADGRPRYPEIAVECLRAGAHVWMEKPPASSSDEVRRMMDAERESGRFVAVGFKKMFFPANVKAKEIVSRPEFGAIGTVTARYPQSLPPAADRGDARAMRGFLDHVVHPWSVLRYLAGPTESILVSRAPDGGTVTSIRFASGAVGALHMPARVGAGSPLERTEIVGTGGNVVIDNNIRVHFYPAGAGPEGGYGRAGTFYGDGQASASWEPEFSLGQLYNKGLFLLGYAPEMRYFCGCVLEGTRPEVGGLEDALELLKIYEAYCEGDERFVRITTGG